MNPFRAKQLRRSILETLAMTHGYALENETLKTHVNDMIRPPLEGTEWKSAIEFLTASDHVRLVHNDLDVTLKQWTITERGKTLLASL